MNGSLAQPIKFISSKCHQPMKLHVVLTSCVPKVHWRGLLWRWKGMRWWCQQSSGHWWWEIMTRRPGGGPAGSRGPMMDGGNLNEESQLSICQCQTFKPQYRSTCYPEAPMGSAQSLIQAKLHTAFTMIMFHCSTDSFILRKADLRISSLAVTMRNVSEYLT